MYRQKQYAKGRLNGNFISYAKRNSLYGLYLRYRYELANIRKHPSSVHKIPMSMREDIVKMDSFMKQSEVLGKYRIETIDQLKDTLRSLTEKINTYTDMRKDLRNSLRRAERSGDTSKVNEIKEQIAGISAQLKTLRKEIDCLDKVENRSVQLAENIKAISADKAAFEQSKNRTRTERRYR